jgi:hypothetical protein
MIHHLLLQLLQLLLLLLRLRRPPQQPLLPLLALIMVRGIKVLLLRYCCLKVLLHEGTADAPAI